jgi:hypothetical protein
MLKDLAKATEQSAQEQRVAERRLRLVQFLCRSLGCGDVHHRPNKLEPGRPEPETIEPGTLDTGGFIAHGMTHNVDVFDGTFRHQ